MESTILLYGLRHKPACADNQPFKLAWRDGGPDEHERNAHPNGGHGAGRAPRAGGGRRERAAKIEADRQGAVDAAKIKADAATKARAAECQGYQDWACRKKQELEQKTLSELSELSQEKTATDHARELDAEIKALKEKIEKAGPVLEANSQGNALARLFALPEGDAAKLSTYQNLQWLSVSRS